MVDLALLAWSLLGLNLNKEWKIMSIVKAINLLFLILFIFPFLNSHRILSDNWLYLYIYMCV